MQTKRKKVREGKCGGKSSLRLGLINQRRWQKLGFFFLFFFFGVNKKAVLLYISIATHLLAVDTFCPNFATLGLVFF